MPRREMQRSSETTPSAETAAYLKPALLDAGFENGRNVARRAAPLRAEAPIQARRAHALSFGPSSAAAAPVESESEIDTRETIAALSRAPLDGDLIRRRWRSLIGRHPPKTLSHALMDRILAWREQVAEGGDISPRSRAILAAALAGKTAWGAKDDQVHDGENGGDHSAHPHWPRAQVRVGTALVREHAGVLHRVTVVAEGFEWEGRVYASLSAVARAITGVRWNGRRFFALDRGARQAVARKSSQQDAGARRASREPNGSSRVGGSP